MSQASELLNEAVKKMPSDLKKKIRFTIFSCLIMSAVLIVILYAMDYLDMDSAERIIYKWSLGVSPK